MTTTNQSSASKPPEGGSQPADLSELNDTDALLDRLGARFASADDLRDPAAAALNDLLADVDDVQRLDEDIPRLVEVLAGRPLYRVGEDETAFVADDDLIRLGPAEQFVIDLTDAAAATASAPAAPAAPADEPTPATAKNDGVAARDREANNVVRLLRLPAARRGEDGEPARGTRAWERALQQASPAAAAVVLLLALGGGVSAVVTGDPMAPVNGVTRAVSQLPGVDSSQDNLNKARTEIQLADRAARANQEASARQHLKAARAALADVPADQRSAYNQAIATMEKVLDPAQPANGIDVNKPGGSVEATGPAAAPTTPATAPETATPTVPVQTLPATPDPTPPPATTTPDSDPTSTPPGEPSAAASPSAS